MAKWGNLKTEVIRIQSTPNFPKYEHFLPPDTHTYVCVSRVKKHSFFEKFAVLCILVTSVLRFALLPYYRRSGILNFSYLKKMWCKLTSQFTTQWTWLWNSHSLFQMYTSVHEFKFCGNRSGHWWWGCIYNSVLFYKVHVKIKPCKVSVFTLQGTELLNRMFEVSKCPN